jgi:hypothetical protein
MESSIKRALRRPVARDSWRSMLWYTASVGITGLAVLLIFEELPQGVAGPMHTMPLPLKCRVSRLWKSSQDLDS